MMCHEQGDVECNAATMKKEARRMCKVCGIDVREHGFADLDGKQKGSNQHILKPGITHLTRAHCGSKLRGEGTAESRRKAHFKPNQVAY